MATKPTNVGVTTVGSQRDRRYPATFHDQHKSARFPLGRPWYGDREIAANRENYPHVQDGFVTAELMRGTAFDPAVHVTKEDAWQDVWTAPWYPEQRFFLFDYRRSRITIQYQPMATEHQRYYDHYYDAAMKIAYEKNWKPVEYGGHVPREIVAVLTKPPISPKIAQAALAGDPWLLGESQDVNEELALLLGLSRRGFVVPRPVQPVGTLEPSAALNMSAADLQAFIADQVQKGVAAALEQQKQASRTKAAETRAKNKAAAGAVP